jgi:hypothetical protein
MKKAMPLNGDNMLKVFFMNLLIFMIQIKVFGAFAPNTLI